MPKPTPNPSSKESNAEKPNSRDINAVKNLRRDFRQFASSLSVVARSVEKQELMKEQPSSENKERAKEEAKLKHDLENGLKTTLTYRQSIREKTALLEGKLRGNAKESEALHCMLRSTPCVGGRKRKFSLVNDGGR